MIQICQKHPAIGDILWLTPIMKNHKVKLTLPIDDKMKNISTLIENLCEIEFSNDGVQTERVGIGHNGQKYLNSVGILNQSPIPFIKLEDYEIENAKNILKNIENPIMINYNVSGNGVSYGDRYRSFSKENIQYICEFLIKKGFTPINLGSSYNSYKINGVIDILDLPLRTVAACFKIVKKIVANESGPLYIMLAVGGRVLDFIPPHCPTWFQYDRYIYTKEDWKYEPEMRIQYADLNNPKEIEEKYKFLLQ